MHKCLNEFEFRHDLTSDYGIICPWASEKSTYNLVATLEPLFFIVSPLFLQVARTTITSRMCCGLASLPLSIWKNAHRLIMREMLWPI